ncbi:MAG: hypothetical protein U0Q12_04110 [Vicinamibacterales bacterium]
MAIFDPSRFARPTLWQRLTASMVFDSWPQALPAGVRGRLSADRHVTYTAGVWQVHIRLESPAAKMAVTGQLTRREGGADGAAGADVRLKSGGKTVAQTATNAFGEFQLDARDARRLWSLDIKLADRRERLDIALPALRLAAEGTATAAKGTRRPARRQH